MHRCRGTALVMLCSTQARRETGHVHLPATATRATPGHHNPTPPLGARCPPTHNPITRGANGSRSLSCAVNLEAWAWGVGGPAPGERQPLGRAGWGPPFEGAGPRQTAHRERRFGRRWRPTRRWRPARSTQVPAPLAASMGAETPRTAQRVKAPEFNHPHPKKGDSKMKKKKNRGSQQETAGQGCTSRAGAMTQVHSHNQPSTH